MSRERNCVEKFLLAEGRECHSPARGFQEGVTALVEGVSPDRHASWVSALSPCLQLSPARPVTRPAGARSGSRHGPCAGPASPWAPASGMPPGDTQVGGCSGPSHARWPRRCRPTCCGRWATQVGLGAGKAASLSRPVAEGVPPHAPVLQVEHSAGPLSCLWVTAPVFVWSCSLFVSYCFWGGQGMFLPSGQTCATHARADWRSSGVLSFPREGGQLQRRHLGLGTDSHAVACVQCG